MERNPRQEYDEGNANDDSYYNNYSYDNGTDNDVDDDSGCAHVDICKDGHPHYDKEGDVCRNDGKPNEMRCYYSKNDLFLCGSAACYDDDDADQRDDADGDDDNECDCKDEWSHKGTVYYSCALLPQGSQAFCFTKGQCDDKTFKFCDIPSTVATMIATTATIPTTTRTVPITTATSLKVCGPGKYLKVKRQGQTCEDCPRGQFQNATAHSDPECLPGADCDDDEYVVKKALKNQDTICGTIDECVKGQYESNAPIPRKKNRKCKPISKCRPGQQYESAPPTTTSNRRCSNCDNTAASVVGGCTTTTTATTTATTTTATTAATAAATATTTTTTIKVRTTSTTETMSETITIGASTTPLTSTITVAVGKTTQEATLTTGVNPAVNQTTNRTTGGASITDSNEPTPTTPTSYPDPNLTTTSQDPAAAAAAAATRHQVL